VVTKFRLLFGLWTCLLPLAHAAQSHRPPSAGLATRLQTEGTLEWTSTYTVNELGVPQVLRQAKQACTTKGYRLPNLAEAKELYSQIRDTFAFQNTGCVWTQTPTQDESYPWMIYTFDEVKGGPGVLMASLAKKCKTLCVKSSEAELLRQAVQPGDYHFEKEHFLWNLRISEGKDHQGPFYEFAIKDVKVLRPEGKIAYTWNPSTAQPVRLYLNQIDSGEALETLRFHDKYTQVKGAPHPLPQIDG